MRVTIKKYELGKMTGITARVAYDRNPHATTRGSSEAYTAERA